MQLHTCKMEGFNKNTYKYTETAYCLLTGD